MWKVAKYFDISMGNAKVLCNFPHVTNVTHQLDCNLFPIRQANPRTLQPDPRAEADKEEEERQAEALYLHFLVPPSLAKMLAEVLAEVLVELKEVAAGPLVGGHQADHRQGPGHGPQH